MTPNLRSDLYVQNGSNGQDSVSAPAGKGGRVGRAWRICLGCPPAPPKGRRGLTQPSIGYPEVLRTNYHYHFHQHRSHQDVRYALTCHHFSGLLSKTKYGRPSTAQWKAYVSWRQTCLAGKSMRRPRTGLAIGVWTQMLLGVWMPFFHSRTCPSSPEDAKTFPMRLGEMKVSDRVQLSPGCPAPVVAPAGLGVRM